MELRKYIRQIISESINENVGNRIIYHFTESVDSLESILKGDSLESGYFNGRFGRGYDNISFTWNPKLWDIEYFGDTKSRYSARISFDYDRMSEKWEFKPFDYGIEEEQEEIVEAEEMHGIIQYITEILISNKEPMEDIKYLKRSFPNLKIKVVKK